MTVKTLKKQLAAAIAMVLVSVIALSSSTYAWFAANNQVTATGMNVKAQAEGGLIISNEAKSDWLTTTQASHNSTVELAPTSTAIASNWYHNISQYYDDADAGQAANTYSELDLALANGVGFVDANENSACDNGETKYYLLNKFYIKSATDEITNTHLYINKVALVASAANSAALDQSLRVLIKIGQETFIYAPGYTDADQTYLVQKTTEVTAKHVPESTIVNTQTAITTIPAYSTATPQEVSIYLYFEGEDPECKSSNIKSNMDALTLTVTFGTTTVS